MEKVAGEVCVRGVWRRHVIPSQGDFSQTEEGAEVLKKQWGQTNPSSPVVKP